MTLKESVGYLFIADPLLSSDKYVILLIFQSGFSSGFLIKSMFTLG